MSRRPEYGPILDQLNTVAFYDPEPASIRHLQRIERRTHACYSAWGGPGFWLTVYMTNSESPDEGKYVIPLPAGVEYFHLRCLVSQREKADPKPAEMEITSTNTGNKTTLTWMESGGGNTLEGAFEIATSGVGGAIDGPLRCRSGVDWETGTDIIEIKFDKGIGKIYGILFQPIHVPR